MTEFIAGITGLIATYRYPVVFLGTLVQGPTLMMASGFLLRLDQFDFFPLYFTLLIADFAGDLLWYWVGYALAEPFLRRFGHIFGIDHKMFERIEDVFRRHDTKILFISKVTMGLGFAIVTLLAAGATRVPFRKYVTLNLLGGFIWTGLLMAVGFFLGNAYLLVEKGFRIVFITATAIIIILFARGVVSFMRKKYETII